MPDQAWMLFSTAAVLGFRHGFDWDHLAAIADIAGSADAQSTFKSPFERTSKITPSDTRAKRCLILASMYALGHATVVAALGCAAINLLFVLPTWVDGFMERIVGLTLLLLALWLFVSLVEHFKKGQAFRLQSRWLAAFSLFEKVCNPKAAPQRRPNTVATVFGIGMLHAIGAETGTQILLITAIGGAGNHQTALVMLASFIVGLLVSNMAIALCSITSFTSAQKAQPLYLTVGVLTCVFSFVVGSYFALGQAQSLPDLQLIFGKL